MLFCPASLSQVAYINAADAAGFSDAAATVTVQRFRVDRDTISDREWLAWLDDMVDSLREITQQVRNEVGQRDADAQRRLAESTRQLRGEIADAVRVGWQLVALGLACSAFGALLGIWA